MNVLYYTEPGISEGGVGNVAFYLPRALSNKVNITYFPRILSNHGIANVVRVYREYFLKEFDLIHFNMVPAWANGSYLLLKSIFGEIPKVLNIHGLIHVERIFNPKGASFYINWASTMKCCKSVDRIIVNSAYMRDSVIASYKIGPGKVVIIPNGVDFSRFKKPVSKLVLEGAPSILYVGGLYRKKGVDLLIRAIAKIRRELPKVRVYLLGNGNINAYKLMARTAGVEENVTFKGFVSDEDLLRHYKSVDFCVFPSRYEPFGIVILEAMASGLPVIASNIGGIKEIISSEKDGFLFNSGDINSLSQAILTLWRQPDFREEISKNASKTAAKYDWTNITERYLKLYKEVER